MVSVHDTQLFVNKPTSCKKMFQRFGKKSRSDKHKKAIEFQRPDKTALFEHLLFSITE